MREDIRLNGWQIEADGPLRDDFLESVFFCGSGRMGVRGYAAGDPRPRPVQQGMFVAGMFDEIKPGITDIIHLPTPVWHKLTVNGEACPPGGSAHRTLDLSAGLLRLTYPLNAPGGTLRVTEERFFDPERPALLSQRLMVESDTPQPVRLESGIFSASCNCPVPDDQVSRFGVIAGEAVADDVWKVDSLVEKPALEDAPSNLAVFGRYLLSPRVMELLADVQPGVGGEIQLTDALDAVLQEEEMYALIIDPADGFDTGTVDSWLETNNILYQRKKNA